MNDGECKFFSARVSCVLAEPPQVPPLQELLAASFLPQTASAGMSALRPSLASAPAATCLALGRLVLYQRAFTLANKGKLRMFSVPVDANQIAQMHLLCGQQVGQRIDHMPLNGLASGAAHIPLICPFLQQKVAPSRRHTE